MRSSIEVRNRLTHPKNLKELNVTDKEIACALRTYSWMVEAFLAIVDHNLKLRRQDMDMLREIVAGLIAKAKAKKK